jgi:hypothetical protein
MIATNLVHEALHRGQLVLASNVRFDGVKVCCSEADAVAWIEANSELELVDITATQDGAWVAIVIAFRDCARSRT